MRQLPLPVALRPASRLETFRFAGQSLLAADVAAAAAGTLSAHLWLHGPVGSGKTHLLQAACARAGTLGRDAIYLPLARVDDPQVLAGLEHVALTCLDDIDAVIGNAQWERGLFGLHVRADEFGHRLVLASSIAPPSMPFTLRDLASRWNSATRHALRPLPEAEQAAALEARAAERGLELPAETLAFLLRRLPRDFAAQCRVLDELDLAALAEQRRLTVPFVRDQIEAYLPAAGRDVRR